MRSVNIAPFDPEWEAESFNSPIDRGCRRTVRIPTLSLQIVQKHHFGVGDSDLCISGHLHHAGSVRVTDGCGRVDDQRSFVLKLDETVDNIRSLCHRQNDGVAQALDLRFGVPFFHSPDVQTDPSQFRHDCIEEKPVIGAVALALLRVAVQCKDRGGLLWFGGIHDSTPDSR
jgi:hypothetical protein